MSHIDRLATTEIIPRMAAENIHCKHATVVQIMAYSIIPSVLLYFCPILVVTSSLLTEV